MSGFYHGCPFVHKRGHPWHDGEKTAAVLPAAEIHSGLMQTSETTRAAPLKSRKAKMKSCHF